MKKLMSILLAIAVVATVAFSMAASAATATTSIMPESADAFVGVEGGNGSITVTKEDSAYKFATTTGWPSAYYNNEAPAYVSADDADATLNFDFQVVSGEAAVLVFFAGVDPVSAADGTWIRINDLFPESQNSASGDLKVGTYKDSVKISELNLADTLYVDGQLAVSGVKVFAAGSPAEVVVNDISVTAEAADDNTGGNTDTTPTSPTTADNTQAVTFAVVAMAAAGVVTLSVVAKKAKSR